MKRWTRISSGRKVGRRNIIPNRRVEINIAHFFGIAILVIGFLISPLRAVWKVVFVVASLLLAAYLLWLDRKDMRRLLAS